MSPEPKAGSFRALVVEDVPVARRLEESLLAHEGYEVDSAENGQTALGRLTVSRYDVVVVDFELPDLDGVEIISRLRALPIHRATPLGMVTSTKDRAARRRGFEAGGAMFITKPFTAKTFRSLIATVTH